MSIKISHNNSKAADLVNIIITSLEDAEEAYEVILKKPNVIIVMNAGIKLVELTETGKIYTTIQTIIDYVPVSNYHKRLLANVAKLITGRPEVIVLSSPYVDQLQHMKKEYVDVKNTCIIDYIYSGFSSLVIRANHPLDIKHLWKVGKPEVYYKHIHVCLYRMTIHYMLRDDIYKICEKAQTKVDYIEANDREVVLYHKNQQLAFTEGGMFGSFEILELVFSS